MVASNANAAPLQNDSTRTDAEPAASPVNAMASRETDYPNSEDLNPDEMRVIACGTGMPTTRVSGGGMEGPFAPDGNSSR